MHHIAKYNTTKLNEVNLKTGSAINIRFCLNSRKKIDYQAVISFPQQGCTSSQQAMTDHTYTQPLPSLMLLLYPAVNKVSDENLQMKQQTCGLTNNPHSP